MIITHIAKPGDCITKIAAKYGSTAARVWNLPQNSDLRQLRKDMNVLFAGDKVVVELKEKQAPVATGALHAFKVTIEATELKIKLADSLGLPIAGVAYRLTFEGDERSGKTGDVGLIDEKVPPQLTAAKLFLGDDKKGIDLRIGDLDPIDELSGVQARLNNLGFDPGEEDGLLGPRTEAALRAFQNTRGLEETGQIDGPTRDALTKAHDGS